MKVMKKPLSNEEQQKALELLHQAWEWIGMALFELGEDYDPNSEEDPSMESLIGQFLIDVGWLDT